MHINGREGMLRGTTDQLARTARCQPAECADALHELRKQRAADISERNGVWTVINRRMRREYMADNGGAIRQRRFRERGGGDPERWTAIRVCILKRDRHVCAYCGRRATTVDHIKPRSKGGDEEFKNLCACCSICNSKKNNRSLEESGMAFHATFPLNNLQLSNAEVTSLITQKFSVESEANKSDDQKSDLKRLNDAKTNGAHKPPSPERVNRSSLNRLQEQDLMGRLRQFVGEDEMARAGGHWRKDHVREHPDLLERALADLESKAKEGTFFDNRGAALEDLIKRWRTE